MTVDIAAGAAQDGAGNPSAAAVQFSIVADLTSVPALPVIGALALAVLLVGWQRSPADGGLTRPGAGGTRIARRGGRAVHPRAGGTARGALARPEPELLDAGSDAPRGQPWSPPPDAP